MKKQFVFTMAWLTAYAVMAQSSSDKIVGGGCEDCDLMFVGMPSVLSWQTNIAPTGEPGEPMIITGTVYKNDGRTPAPDVILYVYHTDNSGVYSPSTRQAIAKKHGHLRGWVKTDANGKYELMSIRPASYPTRNAPAHIHPIIKEKGITRYWIDEYLFEGDPLLTAEERSKQEKRGGSGIISLKKNARGVWEGTRDIILGLNVPGY